MVAVSDKSDFLVVPVGTDRFVVALSDRFAVALSDRFVVALSDIVMQLVAAGIFENNNCPDYCI